MHQPGLYQHLYAEHQPPKTPPVPFPELVAFIETELELPAARVIPADMTAEYYTAPSKGRKPGANRRQIVALIVNNILKLLQGHCAISGVLFADHDADMMSGIHLDHTELRIKTKHATGRAFSACLVIKADAQLCELHSPRAVLARCHLQNGKAETRKGGGYII